MEYIKKHWAFFVAFTCMVIATSALVYSFTTERVVEKNKSGNFAYTPAQVANVMSRTLNASFQPSTQRMAIVTYNVSITNAATLVLGNSGQIILETSPNNSTWTTISIGASSIGSGLLITSVSSVTVMGFVPRGYYVRLRSNNVTGTPNYGAPAGIEILLN